MKLYPLLFPLRYASRLPLSEEDEEYIQSLGDLPGEESISLEYELKIGRCLLVDTIISAVLWIIILTVLLFIIVILLFKL